LPTGEKKNPGFLHLDLRIAGERVKKKRKKGGAASRPVLDIEGAAGDEGKHGSSDTDSSLTWGSGKKRKKRKTPGSRIRTRRSRKKKENEVLSSTTPSTMRRGGGGNSCFCRTRTPRREKRKKGKKLYRRRFYTTTQKGRGHRGERACSPDLYFNRSEEERSRGALNFWRYLPTKEKKGEERAESRRSPCRPPRRCRGEKNGGAPALYILMESQPVGKGGKGEIMRFHVDPQERGRKKKKGEGRPKCGLNLAIRDAKGEEGIAGSSWKGKSTSARVSHWQKSAAKRGRGKRTQNPRVLISPSPRTEQKEKGSKAHAIRMSA